MGNGTYPHLASNNQGLKVIIIQSQGYDPHTALHHKAYSIMEALYAPLTFFAAIKTPTARVIKGKCVFYKLHYQNLA